jgi:hypothetical protein
MQAAHRFVAATPRARRRTDRQQRPVPQISIVRSLHQRIRLASEGVRSARVPDSRLKRAPNEQGGRESERIGTDARFGFESVGERMRLGDAPGQHQRLALHRYQLPTRRSGDLRRREKRRNLDERALRMSRQVGLDLRCASECLRLDRGASRLWRANEQEEDAGSPRRCRQTALRTSPADERTCAPSDLVPRVRRAISRRAYRRRSSRLEHLGLV